jgi:hypothetical protein
MGEITEKKDRREIYRALITDPQTAGTFKKYSFTEFESKLLSDEKAATSVAQRMVSKGLVPNIDSFFEQYINEPAPQAQQPPSRPVQVPTLLQPAQPSQGPSLTQMTGQQAMTPMAPEPQFQPFQFQNEKEIQQAAKSPVFLANKPAMAVMKDREQMAEANPLTWRQDEKTGKFGVFEKDAPFESKPLATFDTMNQAAAAIKTRGAASDALIMPTKEAEQAFGEMSPEQQQAAIQGSSGGALSREAAEKKKTLRQKISESINSVKSYGADLVKSAKRGLAQGDAIQTAKLTDLATGNVEGIDFDAMAKANKVVRDMGATDTELDFAQSDGIWDDISDWMKMVLPVAIESTATLASSGLEEIGTGAAVGAGIGSVVPGAGTVAGAATGAMGGVSIAGYNMELYASILDGLDEKGVDVTNPTALKKAFSDKELMRPILKRANTRAGIIGVVDLVGGEMIGHTGRMLKNAEKAGKMSKGMGRLIRGVERTRGLDEAFTGSAGELAAQVGSGQNVNLQEVALEGVGGAPMVALQGALSRAGQPQAPSQLGGIRTQPVPENAPAFVPEAPVVTTTETPVAPVVTPEAPVVEFATVTDDELNAFQTDPNFAENNPERVAGVQEDADAVRNGEMTLEAIEDPNYRTMVQMQLEADKQQPSSSVGKTFTLKDTERISDGTGLQRKGSLVNDPELVAKQLSVGDKLTFFQERERTGTWDGNKIIEDGTNNPWGLLGVLSDGWVINNGQQANDNTNAGTSQSNVDEGVGQRTGSENVVTDAGVVSAPTGSGTGEVLTEQSAAVPLPQVEQTEPAQQGAAEVGVEPTAKPASLADQIADLRAKEQAEYDAMADPNDKAKRKEIYDRYDKPISDLMAQQKKEEGKQQTNDSKNKPRVSGEVGVGQESVQAEPVEGGGATQTQAGGNVQGNEKAEVKKSLAKRLKGDALLDAEDTLAELADNGATINPDGTVVVYHRTTKDKADAIVKNNEMFGLEDGVFFSTSEKGQAEGYGDVVVKMNVPIEQIQIDDTFGNEAHVRIPTKKANQKISVSNFSPQVAKPTTQPSPLTAFQTKGEAGRKAREALKEEVGPEEFRRMDNIHRNGEKMLKELQTKGILEIRCP